MSDTSALRLLVIGAGPAGTAAATDAAAHGADVTLVETSVVGGAAHLWDCIPSKAMVASSMRLANVRASGHLGLADVEDLRVDMGRLSERREAITSRLVSGVTGILESQGVDIVRGRGRLTGPSSAVIVTEDGEEPVGFDAALLSTGSRPFEPAWADVDGERIITTRHAYGLPELPDHMVIVGSGVTGVEFVHIFSSLGAEVTLLVSRQQVLPHRDAEVAAVLEEDFLERGVRLLKGARASGAEVDGDGVVVTTEDGRVVRGSHCLLAVGSVPNTEDLGLEAAGVETQRGFVTVDEFQRTSVPAIYAAGDITGQLPLSSVASMQGRKVARHALDLPVTPVDLRKASQAIFTEPEIASVGLEEADAAAEGRKVRITKVPFAANPRSLIQGTARGFVKVISDPATHVVLGGTIVGHHASELIGMLALAVQGGLRTDLFVETLMVHPSLAESLVDAAD
ncbi:MAG: FAD-dependent oxidoreductase [Acidimicrobiia bacterium]|nr:FAD-dependent oxidoreductase [Acidimicrobiia bacterium]